MSTLNKNDNETIRPATMFTHLFRFVAVGGSATLLQFVLLYILVETTPIHKVAASALSFAMSAVYNYLMNYYFTFGSSLPHMETASKFAVVVTIGLVLNSAVFALLLYLGAYYIVAQVGATFVTLISNFLLHKLWIYRSQS